MIIGTQSLPNCDIIKNSVFYCNIFVLNECDNRGTIAAECDINTCRVFYSNISVLNERNNRDRIAAKYGTITVFYSNIFVLKRV